MAFVMSTKCRSTRLLIVETVLCFLPFHALKMTHWGKEWKEASFGMKTGQCVK